MKLSKLPFPFVQLLGFMLEQDVSALFLVYEGTTLYRLLLLCQKEHRMSPHWQ